MEHVTVFAVYIFCSQICFVACNHVVTPRWHDWYCLTGKYIAVNSSLQTFVTVFVNWQLKSYRGSKYRSSNEVVFSQQEFGTPSRLTRLGEDIRWFFLVKKLKE